MSENLCPLPWNHLSIEPDGSVYSCCHTSEEAPLGNLKENTLTEIFDGKRNQAIRDCFKQGQTPKQCQICVDAEKWGQLSLREVSQRRFPKVDKENDDLEKHQYEIEIKDAPDLLHKKSENIPK